MISRNTQAKTVVIRIFTDTPIPLTLNDLYNRVRHKLPEVAYSTIYRIVKKMKNEQKLISLDFRDRGGRFEWAKRNHHHHFVCNSCGQITDIDDRLLNFRAQRIAQKTGFVIKRHAIELSGTCKTCQTR